MKAKSNKSFPIVAFGGREYVPYEWRPVPAGFEEAARANPFLEVQEIKPEPEPEKKPAAKPKTTAKKKGAK